MRGVYRLPGGSITTKSYQEYIKAWRDLAEPVCRATGSELRGFDPGISVLFQGRAIELDVDFLKLLNSAFENGLEFAAFRTHRTTGDVVL